MSIFLLLFGGLLGLLILAEFILRAIDYRYDPFDFTIENGKPVTSNPILTTTFTHVFQFFDHFEFDPDLLWRPKADFTVFNAQHLRGPILTEKTAQSPYRVAVIGDSNTLGWVQEPGDNWPGFMPDHFDPGRVEIVNAGVHGHSSHQGLASLKRLLAFEPDHIIISFGANDAHHRRYTDKRMTDFARRTAMLSKLRLGQLLNRVRVAIFTLSRQVEIEGKKYLRHDTQRVPPPIYRENIMAMIDICRAQEIGCILTTRPYHHLDLPGYAHLQPVRHPGGPHDWSDFIETYNDVTREIAREQDIPLVDVARAFEFADAHLYFADRAHLHGIGFRMAADMASSALKHAVPGIASTKTRLCCDVDILCFQGYQFDVRFYKWTGPDVTIDTSNLKIGDAARYLVLEQRGWRGFTHPEDIGLILKADGSDLQFSHKTGNECFFDLPKDLTQIDEVTLHVETFSPGEQGNSADSRQLGIDLLALRVNA